MDFDYECRSKTGSLYIRLERGDYVANIAITGEGEYEILYLDLGNGTAYLDCLDDNMRNVIDLAIKIYLKTIGL